jgi:hypothetical protein
MNKNQPINVLITKNNVLTKLKNKSYEHRR